MGGGIPSHAHPLRTLNLSSDTPLPGTRESTKVESHVDFTESQKVPQPIFLQY